LSYYKIQEPCLYWYWALPFDLEGHQFLGHVHNKGRSAHFLFPAHNTSKCRIGG
jgi:hypothetical protein